MQPGSLPDFIASLGPLALALRLRRLADRLSEEGRRFYRVGQQSSGHPAIEPGWYAMLLLLREHGPMPVTEAAARLRTRHPSVVKTARALQQAGLLAATTDPADRRRRILGLSETARDRLPGLERIWSAFRDELTALQSAGSSGLLDLLESFEAGLDHRPLDQRVRDHLAGSRDARTGERPASPACDVVVRGATAGDRDAVVSIARELVRSADTYAYDPDVSDEELWNYWSPSGTGRGFVAVHGAEVVGMFVVRPNHPGPGAHVANASYAVRADLRGLGLGRKMGQASLDEAAALGFSAMQFNIVVSSNQRAVRLWRSLGFKVVGTIPDGFRLPDGTRVAHHIMYRRLEQRAS